MADLDLCYLPGHEALARFRAKTLSPVELMQAVIARAEAVHTGKTQSVCRCDVFVLKDGVEKLCAVAQGTIAALPAATA